MSFADVVGLLGVLALLTAYALLQREVLDQRSATYSGLNAVGSGLILISLVYDFNLAATLVEGAWFVISLYGLSRVFLRRKANRR